VGAVPPRDSLGPDTAENGDAYEGGASQGPSGTNKALTEYAGESAAELREIPRDIYQGAKETAEDIGRGYVEGATGHVGAGSSTIWCVWGREGASRKPGGRVG
jgi:hypothetical protein